MNEGAECGSLVRRGTERRSMDERVHSTGFPINVKNVPPIGNRNIEVKEVDFSTSNFECELNRGIM